MNNEKEIAKIITKPDGTQQIIYKNSDQAKKRRRGLNFFIVNQEKDKNAN